MTTGPKPPAEVTIDPSLVRALLQEQHTDLAQLALIDIGEGWDNKLFRLCDALAVRLPRRAASAALIEHEQRWLPRLSSIATASACAASRRAAWFGVPVVMVRRTLVRW
jgi:aminoglycoside phosphotransferase (APT) family kinase protein